MSRKGKSESVSAGVVYDLEMLRDLNTVSNEVIADDILSQIVEKVSALKENCPLCGGTGSYPEHDPRDPHENGCTICPIEVQCECNGGDWTSTKNTAIDTVLELLQEKEER